MGDFPFSKERQEELFENLRPDEFGAAGRELPLVVSTIALVGSSGEITIRLRHREDESFVITPHAAGRLAAALADCVNKTGQYEMRLTMHDLDKGRSIAVYPEKGE